MTFANWNGKQSTRADNAGLADGKIKERIVELGGTVVGGSPADFATIISGATEKGAKLIKFAGIKAE